MIRSLPAAAAVVVAALLSPAALAQPQPPQTFVAADACPAPRAKDGPVNPGDVHLVPGDAYAVVERHRARDAHVRVRIPGAPWPEERWGGAACGTVGGDVRPGTQAGRRDTPRQDRATGAESTENVLAVNWQPAFCETRPHQPECRLLDRGELPLAAAHFSIHGLWPQPRGNDYCDGIGPDDPLPPLSAATRTRLAELMPGAMSGLDRHEWTSHGSCYRGAGGAEEYFADTVALTDALNASAVRDLFADAVGRELARSDVLAAFDDAFGAGAGRRVELHCERDGRRSVLVELRIHLAGRIEPDTALADLIAAADPVRGGDCGRRFAVDAAGQQ